MQPTLFFTFETKYTAVFLSLKTDETKSFEAKSFEVLLLSMQNKLKIHYPGLGRSVDQFLSRLKSFFFQKSAHQPTTRFSCPNVQTEKYFYPLGQIIDKKRKRMVPLVATYFLFHSNLHETHKYYRTPLS